MSRWPELVALLVGLATAGFAHTSGLSGPAGVALATATAVAPAVMMRGVGRRILGFIIVGLALIGGALAVMVDSWQHWVVLGLFIVVAAAGIVMSFTSLPVRSRGQSAKVHDPWKDLDAGLDPTSAHDSR